MRFSAGRRATLLSLVVALVVMGITAATASAVIITFPGGKTYSYQPIVGVNGHKFDLHFNNLDYNGGPVMASNRNYLIFWSPSGAGAYPSGYISGLETYLLDLAHDSGTHANVESVSAQYNDAAGNFANYASSYGGSFVDTDPYPASHCPVAAPTTNCLVDGDLQTELGKFLDANGLPRDLTHEYFLLLPPHVENCFTSDGSGSNPFGGCSVNESVNPAYCAYHSNSFTTPIFIYSNDPFVTGNSGCDDGNHPNNSPSDGAIEGGFSHEHNESTTDPIPNSAWTDIGGSGGENGDKCSRAELGSGAFGTPLGGSGTVADPFFNQVINGHHYWYQQEWSNAGDSCLQRSQAVNEPGATFTTTAGSGNTLSFDASASTGTIARYNWQFNDGPGLAIPTEKTTPTVSHTFPSTSPFVVGLTTLRSDGSSLGAGQIVTPGTAGATPGFTTATAVPLVGQPVAFSGLTQLNGAGVFLYAWDFGDGISGDTAAPTHTYAATGTYKVTVTLLSVGGAAVYAAPITVHSMPTAAFSVTTANPVAGQATGFDGSASSEPGGAIASYSWNFGDGTATGTGATTSHIYAAAGTYTATLTVTDGSGVQATQSRQVTVDEPPTATIKVKTRHPATGVGVKLDGSASSDPDGSILAFVWSFGDGSAGTTGASLRHTYRRSGQYTLTLTITDSAGVSASTTKQINVVKAAKISKVSQSRVGAKVVVKVKVSGPGSVKLGSKRVRLRKRGTAKFTLSPGHRKLKLTFSPVAGRVQHKTVMVKFG